MSDLKEQSRLMKLAAETIKSLQQTNELLENNLNKLVAANDVAFNLFKRGNLIAEDLEDYIKEAFSKNLEELNLIKEASVYSDATFDTFSVSNKNEVSGNDGDIINFLLTDLS